MNATRGKILAARAESAETFLARFLGLMGLRHLPVGEALHIAPCNSIHTFFMRIPIDVLFLDAERTVVKRFVALPPWRATTIYRRAKSVLELPAGVLGASGTQEGDRLAFRDVPAALPAASV